MTYKMFVDENSAQTFARAMSDISEFSRSNLNLDRLVNWNSIKTNSQLFLLTILYIEPYEKCSLKKSPSMLCIIY